MDIQTLKLEIKNQTVPRVIRKFLFCDKTACFAGKEDLILELKESIANHFRIHLKDIEIVGSAKLGISLNNERLGKPFEAKSDIDLAVVSSELFDKAWHELLELEFKNWHQLNEKDREFLKDCNDNIASGYISPDKLPSKSGFGSHWWQIFQNLSSKSKYENRKIRGRLFKSWFFVEKYYSIQLVKLKGG